MDGTMRNPAEGRPHAQLWDSCWCAIQSLRPAFSRGITFMWFAAVVVGMMVRSDLLGVTSIIRALNLRPKLYDPLRKHFHSSAIKLDQLAVLWTRTVQRLFSNPVRFNGRLVLVGDGIKIPKRGKQMPGVKLLHQQSNCSTKPEYIMGHSLQAIALLVHAASSFFAVPLASCSVGPEGGKGGAAWRESIPGNTGGDMDPANLLTKWHWIVELARKEPGEVLFSLNHVIDFEWMREAYIRTRKDGATGIDGVTAQDYEANLEVNLRDLLERIKSGSYKAPPVRRTYIPKADGSQRPIGIPTVHA
jgi:hypothetical protein